MLPPEIKVGECPCTRVQVNAISDVYVSVDGLLTLAFSFIAGAEVQLEVVTEMTSEGCFWTQLRAGRAESYSRLMERLQKQASEVSEAGDTAAVVCEMELRVWTVTLSP